MPTSAGLLMFRHRADGDARRLEVLLVHPGGPFFRNKHEGTWTTPKGGRNELESWLQAARREFEEETSIAPPPEEDAYLPLGSIRQKGGKVVHAWAFEGDCDPNELRSTMHDMEWPPRSGTLRSFPEVDGWQWFDTDDELWRERMMESQWPLVERLREALTKRRE